MEQAINAYVDPQTLLVVDDDEINRSILNNLFANQYTVEEAENGKIGLEYIMAAPEKYSAVLLDVIMPEMDGLEVLVHLQNAGLLKTIPVFLITAETSDDVMREAYRMGVMDVILKPVVPYIVSVSYTHLDVYKRQAAGFPAFPATRRVCFSVYCTRPRGKTTALAHTKARVPPRRQLCRPAVRL